MIRSPELVWNAAAELGEGALWSAEEEAVYWVDILGRRVRRQRWAAQARTTWDLPVGRRRGNSAVRVAP